MIKFHGHSCSDVNYPTKYKIDTESVRVGAMLGNHWECTHFLEHKEKISLQSHGVNPLFAVNGNPLFTVKDMEI